MRAHPRAGTEEAYVEYVTARLPALHRAAYLLCGDAHRADDVVQNTITKLYQHWKRVARTDNIDAYVHRMLVHALIDEKRLSWAKVRLVAAADDAAAAEPHAHVDERSDLVAALRELPPRQRAVLV